MTFDLHVLEKMGSGQSSAETEREVTVEELAGDDGQPQIVVTQDFLEYIQEKQEEGEESGGGRGGSGSRRSRPSPPPYPESHEENDIPHLTTDDMISGALSGGRRGGGGEGRGEENVWRRKYEMEREKNAELKHVTENEFVKKVDEVRQKFTEAGVEDMLPVCDNRRTEILHCYHSNPDRPLLCSSEVQAFSECVERARQKLLQAK